MTITYIAYDDMNSYLDKMVFLFNQHKILSIETHLNHYGILVTKVVSLKGKICTHGFLSNGQRVLHKYAAGLDTWP